MPLNPHICMLAAENDSIPGAKVGGIGDVIRDIPPALAAQGASVTVIIPAYGLFHTYSEATQIGTVQVWFMGRTESVHIVELYADRDKGVRTIVVHHPLFAAGGAGSVYCNDGSDQPFATDASKFALFCTAALKAITDGIFGAVDVLHLHDWHAGFAAILREYDPAYEQLKSIPTAFTIHNLALQGIRPLQSHPSSLQSWFPDLSFEKNTVADLRWPDCVNPVAAAIRLADKVHTVSPTYSLEILQASAPERGFHGGEGLEKDLQMCASRQALVGIINGIDYEKEPATKTDWPALIKTLEDTLLGWLGDSVSLRATEYIAHQRIQQWQEYTRPQHIMTSVGRLTDQKVALLLMPAGSGRRVLDLLLDSLKGKGVFILLGSGDSELEAQCQRCAAQHQNFLFLNRYEQSLSDLLFANGDLFLMPSSFEPCGISQMLAMHNGQPCLVHAVGGLKDTVKDGVNGFHFTGDSMQNQSANMLQRFNDIITMRESKPDQYQAIADVARSERFLWQSSAQQYLQQLYL